mmetsp:Transcript_5416/g.5551  ORF Transcript_5416/g.5551 Transcript_5416/m.5551 type:complete len:409 (-) Transcript_5416:171-1397(-)
MTIRRLFSLLEKSRSSPDISRLLSQNSNTFDMNEFNTDLWTNRLNMDKDILDSSSGLLSLDSSSGLLAEVPVAPVASAPSVHHKEDYARKTTEEVGGSAWVAPPVTQAGIPYNPCTEIHTVAYLNSAEVQHALHIIPTVASPPVVWAVCSDPIFLNWPETDSYADTTKLYGQIYRKVQGQRERSERTDDFKMLIYSGDTDGVCATIGTQNWIYNVAAPRENSSASYLSSLSSTSSLWQPWEIDQGESDSQQRQQGGFLTRFKGSFSFVTVHSAGHEVPAYQPVAALSVLAGFLSGSIFTPNTYTTPPHEVSGESAGNIQNNNWDNTLIIILTLLAILGLFIVCFILYRREKASRRGPGLSVSMIDSQLDALDDAGVVDDVRGNTGGNSQKSLLTGTKYVSMPTEEVML